MERCHNCLENMGLPRWHVNKIDYPDFISRMPSKVDFHYFCSIKCLVDYYTKKRGREGRVMYG